MTNGEIVRLLETASDGIPHESLLETMALATTLRGRERAQAGRVYAALIAERKLAREPLVKPKVAKPITAGREAMNRAWRARAELEARRDLEL